MTAPTGAEALTRARRADSDRRRQRVEHALELLTATSEELTVAAVARAAKVSRAFLYRHGDLRAQVLERMAAAPRSAPATSAATRVSDASLLAEVVNQRERNQRLARHIAKLEARLSELLGEQVFRASGLGARTTSSSSTSASTPWSRTTRCSARRSPTSRTSWARPGPSTGSC